MSINELKKQADELAASEVAIETNEGTFGATECCRVTGSGDPRYGNYTIYIRVGDGARRVTGRDPENAPGYGRHLKGLDDAQRQLRELRKQIADATK